jgi:hypothetical protein
MAVSRLFSFAEYPVALDLRSPLGEVGYHGDEGEENPPKPSCFVAKAASLLCEAATQGEAELLTSQSSIGEGGLRLLASPERFAEASRRIPQ